jgi:predicted hotdog family 3-hydroxylacyl-ACP dehydratase
MSGNEWRMADLLTHAGTALLLDEILSCSDTDLSASVTIRPASPFRQGNGVPAHVGLEYMAQACGAFSGVRALRAAESPRMGFLLGTRRYLATRAWFIKGERLVVAVDLVYRDDEVGVFDCVIRCGAEAVATAQLIVAEPKNVAGLLGRRDGMDDG